MIDVENVLCFSFELQLYKKIRMSQVEHKKRSYLKGYSRSAKTSAVNNLISILEGNKRASLSKTDIKALRNGALGRLCSKYAELFGFSNRTRMFESRSLMKFCNAYVNQSLKFDDGDLHNRSKDCIKGEISDAYQIKNKVKNDFAGLSIADRIDGTIDIAFDFCKNQLSNHIFMDTPFKNWKLVKKDDVFLEFMVGSTVFYCSNRIASAGELRSDNLLRYMKDNPNSCMNDLASDPTNLVNYALNSQLNAVGMFLNGEISQATLKKALGKIHKNT
jgi:hypothetical protein